jgi:hypothetical protein
MNIFSKSIILAALASLLLSSCDYGSRQAFADSIKQARQAQKK